MLQGNIRPFPGLTHTISQSGGLAEQCKIIKIAISMLETRLCKMLGLWQSHAS